MCQNRCIGRRVWQEAGLAGSLADLLKAAGPGADFTEHGDDGLFEYLFGMAVVQAVIERDNCVADEAARAVLATAAERIRGTAGRSGIPRRDIAVAALGLAEYQGVRGLLDRLLSLSNDRLKATSMRTHWYELLTEYADALRMLQVSDVPPTTEAGLDEVNQDFVCLSTDTLWVVAGRRIEKLIVTRELRAMQSQLSRFSFRVNYPQDLRAEVLQPFSQFNCDIESSESDGLGWKVTTLKLPVTPRGQKVRFGYSVVVNTDVDDLPYLRSTGRFPSRNLRLGVQFDRDDLPKEVWSFRGLNPEEDPNKKSNADRIQHPSKLGYLEVQFADEQLGRCQGVAWERR